MPNNLELPSVVQLRSEWITALRSGDYTQAREALKVTRQTNGGNSHCCLGVAGEVLAKHGVARWAGYDLHDERTGYSSSSVLPETLCPLLGLYNLNASSADKNPNSQGNLATLNDQGATFLEIADLLEGKVTFEELNAKYPQQPKSTTFGSEDY